MPAEPRATWQILQVCINTENMPFWLLPWSTSKLWNSRCFFYIQIWPSSEKKSEPVSFRDRHREKQVFPLSDSQLTLPLLCRRLEGRFKLCHSMFLLASQLQCIYTINLSFFVFCSEPEPANFWKIVTRKAKTVVALKLLINGEWMMHFEWFNTLWN